MIRPGLLGILVVVLAPLSGLSQMGGMGGMGGGMMGGPSALEEERVVKVEMTGGQSVSGKIRLGPIVVDSDLGQYELNPEKVKTIRLTKSVQRPANGGDGGLPYTTIQGTVVTSSGKEISGIVHIPQWKLEIDDGTLSLIPAKLKTLNFAAPPGRIPDQTGANLPGQTFMRIGRTMVVTSPAGDQVTFVDLGTKKTTSIQLSDSEREPSQNHAYLRPKCRRTHAERAQDHPHRRCQQSERNVAHTRSAGARQGRGLAHRGPRGSRLRTRPVHLRLQSRARPLGRRGAPRGSTGGADRRPQHGHGRDPRPHLYLQLPDGQVGSRGRPRLARDRLGQGEGGTEELSEGHCGDRPVRISSSEFPHEWWSCDFRCSPRCQVEDRYDGRSCVGLSGPAPLCQHLRLNRRTIANTNPFVLAERIDDNGV